MPPRRATSDSLSVSVINGTLTLGSTAGLTFTSGSNGSSLMTVTGTVANLNAALNGLVYTPTPGYYGTDYLEVSVNNPTDSQTGSANVPITVNGPPSIGAPYSNTIAENGFLGFSGDSIGIFDAAAVGTSDSLSLSASHGKFTLGSTNGLTFISGSNNSSSMTVNGTLANLNAAVTGLEYLPNHNYLGPEALQLSVTDSIDNLTGSATVLIAVVVPPSVSTPSFAGVVTNKSYLFPAGSFSLADVNASGSSESLSLGVSHGMIVLFLSNGTTEFSSTTLTGTLATLNADVNSLEYFPNPGYSGTDFLYLSLNNNLENVGFSAGVNLYINSGAVPSITAPFSATLNEYTSFNFSSSVGVIDPYANQSSDSVALAVSDGKLTLGSTTGLTFSAGSNGSSSMTITGTLPSLNAALTGLTYAPNLNYSGPDSLQISVTNSLDNLSSSRAVGLTVVTTPTIFAPASATAYENRSFTFSNSAISVTDPSASGTSDSLSLSVSNGQLTLPVTTGLTFNAGSNNSSSMTVTGTLANLNASLNGLAYAQLGLHRSRFALDFGDELDRESDGGGAPCRSWSTARRPLRPPRRNSLVKTGSCSASTSS